jgi:hypothetical protein
VSIPKAMRTFTFNRPITMLFALPLLVLVSMFAYGLTEEFHLSVLLMLIVTTALVVLLVYYSLLRKLSVGEVKAIWRTPANRWEIPMVDLRHYGIVKFRRFRFAYLSRAEQAPFEDPAAPIVSDENTFVIQYRAGAWKYLEGLVKKLHPHLQPQSITRP